jgi:hypothetical protein
VLIAITIKFDDFFGPEGFGQKSLRWEDRFWLVRLDGRRNYNNADLTPRTNEAKSAQEIPAIHHWHSKIEQNKTGTLDLRRQPFQCLLPVAGFPYFVTFAFDELRDGFSRIGVIFDNQNATHVTSKARKVPYGQLATLLH